MAESPGPHGLISAAQEALAKAAHAAGIAAVAAGIGLAALVVGMIAVVMATVAIMSRAIGEALSLLAALMSGMIDAVVAMVPDILHAGISVVAMICIWFGFQWAWAGYAQDMPAWLAAIVAALIAVLPVAYGFYRHLWPWVLAASLAVAGGAWLLMQAGTMLRTLAVLGVLGAVVWQDVMKTRGE